MTTKIKRKIVVEGDEDKSHLGLVHVITGDGKGKTTASIGLAVRAMGSNLRVCMMQFLKSGSTGEIYTIKKYLPNAISIAVKTPRGWQAERHDSPEVKGLIKCFSNLLERFLRSFKLWYMQNRRTTEIISSGIIRFHPRDARQWVLQSYKRKSKIY